MLLQNALFLFMDCLDVFCRGLLMFLQVNRKGRGYSVLDGLFWNVLDLFVGCFWARGFFRFGLRCGFLSLEVRIVSIGSLRLFKIWFGFFLDGFSKFLGFAYKTRRKK